MQIPQSLVGLSLYSIRVGVTSLILEHGLDVDIAAIKVVACLVSILLWRIASSAMTGERSTLHLISMAHRPSIIIV